MKKVDSRLLAVVVVLIVFSAIFTSTIIGIKIKDTQQPSPLVDKNAALIVAQAKLIQMKKTNYSITSSNEVFDDQGRIIYRVYNLQPQGYIVVAAYYDLPPVIAYSFTSTFFEKGTILYDLVKTDILLRLSHFSEIPETIKERNNDLWNNYLDSDPLILENSYFRQWPIQGTTISEGWIETKWHQGSPYNDFCPIDLASEKRSVAGCPSVAIAQILNYHETTHNIQFNDSDDYYHAFWGNNYWIDDDYDTYDFPSFPELNTYLDTLVGHYQNQLSLTDEDKASLVFACGVAAEQVYHPNASGTFGVDQAFQAYQRFAFDDIELLDDNDPDVYERVQNNIKNGLPVHLAVVDEAVTTGHNLVIDGYNNDGFYHLNFGWGGPYDGWYKIPEELPFELNFLEGIIVDIINYNEDSDLHGEGVLYWPDVKPGTTVEGSFVIENVGAPGSEIDWEIIVWPGWGDWTFDPSSGENLTPENSPLTINVSVEVPNRINRYYNGYVKVVDIDNNGNSCLIHISLITPHTKAYFYFFEVFLQRHPYAFPILRYFLKL
jgi:hypothetical protein